MHERDSLDKVMKRIERDSTPQTIENNDYFELMGRNPRGLYQFFRYSHGDILSLTASQMMSNRLIEIAPKSFWVGINEEGDGPGYTDAGDKMFQITAEMPLVTDDAIKKLGTWIDGDDIVSNEGDNLLVNGMETSRLDFKSSVSKTYLKDIGTQVSGAVPFGQKDFNRIFDAYKTFNWTSSSSAYLMFGWAMLAPISGALHWRPHVWITGSAGNGKSTVSRFTKNVTGGPNRTVFVQGMASKAGIKQKLNRSSLPCVFDELENTSHAAQLIIEAMMEWQRICASSKGGNTLQGTKEGVAEEYTADTMFSFASITPSITHAQDIQRIKLLDLQAIEDKDTWLDLEDYIEGWEYEQSDSPRRSARGIINNAHITLANVKVFVGVVGKMHSQRKGDVDGSLLGGAWSMLNLGRTVSVDEAKAFVKESGVELFTENIASYDSGGDKVFRTLLDHRLELEPGVRMSVWQICNKYNNEAGLNAAGADGENARNALSSVGLSLMRTKPSYEDDGDDDIQWTVSLSLVKTPAMDVMFRRTDATVADQWFQLLNGMDDKHCEQPKSRIRFNGQLQPVKNCLKLSVKVENSEGFLTADEFAFIKDKD